MSLVWLSVGLVAAAALAEGPVLNRSEVVFMGPKDPAVYRAFGATMVSWGGAAAKDDEASRQAFITQRIEPAKALGMRYCPGLAFRTAFAGMIDFDPNFMDSVTRDLDGQPILVPWLWDHHHKGHGAYWFCTHAPGYQAFLRYQARRAAVPQADGLHIDDYAGTSGCPGGCFCPHCLKDFTTWLKAHATPDELKAAGVTTLDGFDYAAFLKAKGVTADDVRKKRWTLPLNAQYESFQILTNRDFVASIKAYAEEQAGHKLLLSVNSSATSPQSLVIAPVIDYFCGEVGHHADQETLPTEPIYVYKLADALGKGVACTAAGWDWALVNEQHRPGLVRMWIAEGYASGHSLMAPWRQWAYTKEKGSHYYQATAGDYEPYYRFVRDHADLFDGYDAAPGEIALVYSNYNARHAKRGAMPAVDYLTKLNVPFHLVLAGDDWLDARLTPETLRGAKAVVVPQPNWEQGDQAAALKACTAQTAAWPEKPDETNLAEFAKRLETLAPARITVTGATGIVALPRVKRADPQAPAILHLLNRAYVGATDSVTDTPSFTVTLPRALTGRTYRAATLHAPAAEPVTLTVTSDATATRIEVPKLGVWGVIKLD